MKNFIGLKQGRRGIASWIAQMLTALVAIGVVAFLYFLFFARYFDIQVIVDSAEVQRHVINMAQVLLSSDKLVYEEDIVGYDGAITKRFHRAVFDKTKLDEQLLNEAYFDTYKSTTKDSEIQKEVSYTNTSTDIVVYDIDSGTKWILSFGETGIQGIGELLTCLYNNIDKSFFGVFPNPFNVYLLWDHWQAKACFDTYTTKIGVFEKEFPVLIKVGDELHAGRLLIRLMEL